MPQVSRILISLPGNTRCWNCGAELTTAVAEVRQDLAICGRCAESYDHYAIHLPNLAYDPDLADRSARVHGIRCWTPQKGDQDTPWGFLQRLAQDRYSTHR